MQSIQELIHVQRQLYWIRFSYIDPPEALWHPLEKEFVHPCLYHRRGEKIYYKYYVNNEEEAYEPGEDNLYP